MIGFDDPGSADPFAPCGCGSGKKYGRCCLSSDPLYLAAVEALANLSVTAAPVRRPGRWQADLVTFPLRDTPVEAGQAAFLAVCPASKFMLVLALEPVTSVPAEIADLVDLYGDTLLDAADGRVKELPRVLEVRDPALVEPLRESLVPLDVEVECGSDFGTLQVQVTKILTEAMTLGTESIN